MDKKKMNSKVYAKKYISKENANYLDRVASRLYRRGYSVEQISDDYGVSIEETLRSMTRLEIEDVRFLLDNNWMPFVIADLHSKVIIDRAIKDCEGGSNAWLELIDKHTH